MLRGANAIVAATPELRDLVVQRHRVDANRIAVVSNGVDTERFRPMDRGTSMESAGLPPGDWICFVGNLVAWQGLEILLKAMPLIVDGHPHARLVIVGDGMLRPDLEAAAHRLEIEPAVSFVGSIPYERVPHFIGASRLCVAPFTRRRNEIAGLSPLKLYEYMACGRPVVASDLPGVREVIRVSGAGTLVPPDDPAALAEAISGLLADPSSAEEMGRRGRENAVARHSWAESARKVEAVLGRVVGK